MGIDYGASGHVHAEQACIAGVSGAASTATAAAAAAEVMRGFCLLHTQHFIKSQLLLLLLPQRS
jgi:hypothetical protein